MKKSFGWLTASLSILALVIPMGGAFGGGPYGPPQKRQGNPAYDADMPGRELDVFGLGALGHLGLWNASSGRIVEVLNEAQVIQINTLEDFKARVPYGYGGYWGAAYWQEDPYIHPSLRANPALVCNNMAVCDSLIAFGDIRRNTMHVAALWWAVGADYTITTYFTRPAPGRYAPELIPPWAPPGTQPPYIRPQRGVFRSDGFIREAWNYAGAAFATRPNATYPAHGNGPLNPLIFLPNNLYLGLFNERDW